MATWQELKQKQDERFAVLARVKAHKGWVSRGVLTEVYDVSDADLAELVKLGLLKYIPEGKGRGSLHITPEGRRVAK